MWNLTGIHWVYFHIQRVYELTDFWGYVFVGDGMSIKGVPLGNESILSFPSQDDLVTEGMDKRMSHIVRSRVPLQDVIQATKSLLCPKVVFFFHDLMTGCWC